MGKGFYVSKLIAFVAIFFVIAAVATIIALSVVYANEKSNNNKEENGGSSTTATTTTTTTVSTTTTTTSNPTTPVSNEPWDKYRLPKTLIPDHYDVDLRPVLEKDTRGLYVFHGKSVAHFRSVTPTNLVIIHSNRLNYTNIVLKDNADRDITINSNFIVQRTTYLVLQLAQSLQSGNTYKLHTEYIGELADDLAGFYRSEYVEDNTTKIIATTQMQAPDARKAFPCFDEPAMKATFSITLRYKPGYVALSNMNHNSITTETWGGQSWEVKVFDRTPKMSTYLVAFIVSEFTAIGDDRVKIWGRKKAIVDEKQGDYALNVTKPILDFFEKYYGVPYPLPKSDQVALPDFSAGAMENWGLVTYRETALLWHPLESSIGNKERVVSVIAHELAHQWFGNLVTIRWWNDLWLNEGFASYVEYLGADIAEPTWNLIDLSVLYDVHRVMAVDALVSSHPLTSDEAEVNSPSEISGLFDSIAYSKGASVIRMLSSFLTEELFVQGLATYLKAFEYDSTVYTDLWTHLQAAVDKQNIVTFPPNENVSTIMDTWVLQMGFPVVTIDTAAGALRQQHFLLDPDSIVTRPSPFEYLWKVPITYLKTNGDRGNWWFRGRLDQNDVFRVSGNDWLLVNLDVTGYYRVNYDDRNWDRLLNQLDTNLTAIPLINRAQIIDDAFNLARAKYVSTARALDTTKFLSKEVEYMPWQAALGSLSYFVQMFDRAEVYGPMKAYMVQQVKPLFEYFRNKTNDWANRPATLTEQYNEINAVSTACTHGIKECEELAVKQFSDWMTTGVNRIHPNLRNAIYCNAIAKGGIEEWNFAWQEYKKTDNAQEADKLRAGLACSKEPWILNRLLEYALDGTIRKQDAISTVSNVANNAVGQTLAWDFVRAHWKTFLDYFGGTISSFGNLITGVTRRFSNDFDLQQLEQFKKDYEVIGFGTASRALEQSIERTKANIKWVNENKKIVKEWFEGAVVNP
ncbi:PREDICTED: aminopeptidase N-like [Nanorana parkeri]|uniref:aminopeptidase N-like n=1 Tax=Nanorana parkeri TaxID=125878 RepID=UPI000854D286|nr:PREDICTED: aminopeptidase N-like [Nanorana parkeri]